MSPGDPSLIYGLTSGGLWRVQGLRGALQGTGPPVLGTLALGGGMAAVVRGFLTAVLRTDDTTAAYRRRVRESFLSHLCHVTCVVNISVVEW